MEALSRKCDKSHEHVKLLANRAVIAQAYPAKLCEAIVHAFRRQLEWDSRDVHFCESDPTHNEACCQELLGKDAHADGCSSGVDGESISKCHVGVSKPPSVREPDRNPTTTGPEFKSHSNQHTVKQESYRQRTKRDCNLIPDEALNIIGENPSEGIAKDIICDPMGVGSFVRLLQSNG